MELRKLSRLERMKEMMKEEAWRGRTEMMQGL
jgi:hypothetical protein